MATDDPALMSKAGASTQAEYERRKERDRVWRKATLRLRLALLVATPLLAFVMVHAGARALRTLETDAIPNGITVPTHLVNLAGLFVAFNMTLPVWRDLWARRRSVENYRVGAVGERATGAALAALERRGFTALHDLALPGRRENIDHLLIGPAGVYVVETKNWSGQVTVGRRLRQNGRDRKGVIAQAQRQAAAVAAALDVPVRPFVCIHGADVRRGWFNRPVVDGVTVLTPRRMQKTLLKAPARLIDAEVERLVATARSRFRGVLESAREGQACGCGGELVVRTRKKSGERFLGCSNFPRCRRTAALAVAP